MNNYENTCANFVHQSPCFDQLTEQEIEMVEKNQVRVVYKKGETICKQGSFASHIMFLEEGLVKIYLEGNPRNLILTITPSNHLIGLPSIYEGNNTFLYSVSTYIDSKVRLIDVNVFKQLIRHNANFAAKIINVLNENTAQVYGRFFCLTRKQLHGRMADILLCLSDRIFKSREFNLPLSRNDLGELASMSTESVIRIIKEFKDDELIKVNGKFIEILNHEKMMKISELC